MPKGIVALSKIGAVDGKDTSSLSSDCDRCDWCEGSGCEGGHCDREG